MIFLSKAHNPSLIKRKTLDQSRLGALYRIICPELLKKNKKKKKGNSNIPRDWRDITANAVVCCIKFWKRRENINGNASENQIKSGVKNKTQDGL